MLQIRSILDRVGKDVGKNIPFLVNNRKIERLPLSAVKVAVKYCSITISFGIDLTGEFVEIDDKRVNRRCDKIMNLMYLYTEGIINATLLLRFEMPVNLRPIDSIKCKYIDDLEHLNRTNNIALSVFDRRMVITNVLYFTFKSGNDTVLGKIKEAFADLRA